MTKFICFTVKDGFPYEHLKQPLEFLNDPHGLTNWVLRFPLHLYSFDRTQKHSFSQGNVRVQPISGQIDEQKWKHFVLTDSCGARLYCTSQIFYEKGTLFVGKTSFSGRLGESEGQLETFYVPKCVVLISEEPYFKLHINLMRIYGQIQKQRPNVSHPINRSIVDRYLWMKQRKQEDQFEVDEPEQQIIRAENEVIFDYYLRQCRQHKGGETVLIAKQSNLPVLHLYKLQPHKLLQLSHFFFLPLSPKTIANCLTAILLEKQIIVSSRKDNLNVAVIESLLQLIRPLKWMHMLVHSLPPQLFEAANLSFMPFLVGIDRQFLGSISIEDKFVLHVEEDRLSMPTKLPPVGTPLQEFVVHLGTPEMSFSNQKGHLLQSILLMCKLLKPIIDSDQTSYVPTVNNWSFYQQFSETTHCFQLLQTLDNPECKQFLRLGRLSEESRKTEIEREFNRLSNSVRRPRIKCNETEWLEYYLFSSCEKDGRGGLKMPSLKDIQQDVINEAKQQRLVRKLSAREGRGNSLSSRSRNRQKIKVSAVKHEQPFLVDLLQRDLPLSLSSFDFLQY